jgi:serine O-acetyltransferase
VLHLTSRDEIARQLREHSSEWFHGRTCHPEPDEIERMIEAVQWVLLPNYFQPTDHTSVMSCIDRLHSMMSAQIYRALFQRCPDENSSSELKTQADAKSEQILAALPELQRMLHEDVVETYQSDPAASGYDEVILTYPGLFALMVYRLAHVMHQSDIPLLPRMMTETAHRMTGIDIHPGATLGRGVMIDHGTGIVIGETAMVGNRVKIYQGVTLGALYFPRDEAGFMLRQTKRHPTVEDDVILYANSTVLGGDTVIGHHSVIGSNAWITESIPPYSKVLYQTESIIKTSGMIKTGRV